MLFVLTEYTKVTDGQTWQHRLHNA